MVTWTGRIWTPAGGGGVSRRSTATAGRTREHVPPAVNVRTTWCGPADPFDRPHRVVAGNSRNSVRHNGTAFDMIARSMRGLCATARDPRSSRFRAGPTDLYEQRMVLNKMASL